MGVQLQIRGRVQIAVNAFPDGQVGHFVGQGHGKVHLSAPLIGHGQEGRRDVGFAPVQHPDHAGPSIRPHFRAVLTVHRGLESNAKVAPFGQIVDDVGRPSGHDLEAAFVVVGGVHSPDAEPGNEGHANLDPEQI